LEEEKILKEIKQKVRENFYQITQYALGLMDGFILMDDLKHAIENSNQLGKFLGEYTGETMPGYEGTEGYTVWGPGRFEGEEICVSCQILDSGKLRIVNITD
jgi:hypothetical protein